MSHLARRRAPARACRGVFRVHGDVHTRRRAPRKLNRSDSVSYSRRIAVYRAHVSSRRKIMILVNITFLEEATYKQVII